MVSSLRELILNIKLKDYPEETLFVAIKKNYYRVYKVFYKNKYYDKASLVALHLPANFFKLHGKYLIIIFNFYY